MGTKKIIFFPPLAFGRARGSGDGGGVQDRSCPEQPEGGGSQAPRWEMGVERLSAAPGTLNVQRPVKTSKKQMGRRDWSPGGPRVSQIMLWTGTTDASFNKYPVVHLLWAGTVAVNAAGNKKTAPAR